MISINNKNNYSDDYDNYKKTGVINPFIFISSDYNQEEQFKPITNDVVSGVEPGRYFVSNYGIIYDKKKDLYTKGNCNRGYYSLSFNTDHGYKNERVHRVELKAFNPNENHKNLQVNHIDGIPGNNKLYNLEWTTPKENSDHAMITKLHEMNGENNPNNKLTEEQIHEICKLIETGEYFDTEIAKMYNVSYTNISDIHNGNIWSDIGKQYDLSAKKPLNLTEEQVHEICKLLEEQRYFSTEIAKMFGTTHGNIIAIRKGKVWKHISSQYNIIDEKAPRKFTKEQIHDICKLLEAGELTDKEIAIIYNTSSHAISSIRKRKIHKEIGENYNLENAKTTQNNIKLQNKRKNN